MNDMLPNDQEGSSPSRHDEAAPLGATGSEDLDAIVLAVPDDWVRLPLDGSEFDAAIRTQRRRLLEEASLSKADLHRLELTTTALRNDLESANVRMIVALIADIEADVESEDEDETDAQEAQAVESGPAEQPSVDPAGDVSPEAEGPRLLLATAAVSVVSRFDLDSDVPLTPSVLKVAFDMEDRRSEDDPVKVVNLEEPEIVHLPAGQAVRLVQLHTSRNALTLPEAAMFIQQFYVPLDENGTRAACVVFASPSIEVAQPLSGLFDAMMETFELLSPGDERDIMSELSPSEDSSTEAGEVSNNRE